MRHFQHKPVLAIKHHLVAGLQPAMAHGHAIDAGAVGTAQIAQQHAITMHFHAGVSFGEGRIVNSDVSVAAAANQAGPRQGEAAAVVQTANSAQQPLLLVAAFLVLRRRRLQQALDFTLQDHLHAVHIHRIARTQQRHAPHRSTVHMNAADPVADLQPQAAIIQQNCASNRAPWPASPSRTLPLAWRTMRCTPAAAAGRAVVVG